MIRFLDQPEETALIDAARFKAELNIVGTDAARDALIDGHILAATGTINKACGRVSFGAATAEETFFHARAGRPLWLTHWPVTVISSVTEAGEPVAAEDYEIDADRKLWRLMDGQRASWSCGRVVVTYEGGYELPDECPPDLAGVCLELATASWSARGRDPMIKAEDVPGIGKIEYWVGAVAGLQGDMSERSSGVLLNYQNFAF